ncbi:uncharacterized protein N0V89_005997 [Didymosphaeria variabile]|uniref:Uncharacterized protein n=1 Tax=Didymosphaeria variabile TaxID=1932322 RepID=A0A9W9CC95_9PLEO|nr:uncharacterized protein N0V89_005997 [Didymosphaeria variabile]KAJ4354263.1 hypothetical protein N0V89_005997 [Didymosphaeria variabile]
MGGTMEEHSEPLLESARDGSSDIEEGTMRGSNAPTKFYENKSFLFASVFWFAGSLLVFASALLLQSRSRGGHSEIYSPVQDHVRYKTVVFDASLGKKTIYMEDPSPRVDKAWEDLYDFGISWITPSEASQLPNATSRLVENPSHFVTGLDVFHQLHCLNLIRKRLNPEYYVNDTHVHIEHCLDQLRQALMCSADTATIPWLWSKSQGRTIADARTTHTCRDYDAIREWARERKVEGGFAKDTYVEGSAVSD